MPRVAGEILEVAAEILGTCLRDEPWQDIGFRRRPKHGAFFQRFRPKWKIKLEKSVLQQMLSLFTAANILAGTIPAHAIDDVVGLYVEGFGPVGELFRTLGYQTRCEATDHLRDSIRLYANNEPSEWPRLLVDSLQVKDVPDKKLAAQLLVGAVRFTRNVHGMTSVLEQRSRKYTG